MSQVHNTSVQAGLRISYVEPADFGRWDDFAHNHPHGTLCHSTAWRQVLEEAFPHVTGHFLALEESQTRRIIAGLPIYSLRSWVLGNRLVCVPFAAWCDPLVGTQHELALLLGEARKLKEEVSGRFAEVRVRRTGDLVDACGLIRCHRWLHHYVTLDWSREKLWQNLSRTAVQRLVRSAEKSGVAILREDSSEAVGLFHELLSETRRRLGLPQIPINFFRAMHRNLGTEGLVLLLARKDGHLVGSVLATKCRATFHLEYAAVATGEVPRGTMQLLYWRAMELAQDEGCAEFSLGRTNSDHAGLIAYKRHWGCVEEELYEFRSHSKPSSNATTRGGLSVKLARRVMQRLPRPLYDLAGSIIYRHR